MGMEVIIFYPFSFRVSINNLLRHYIAIMKMTGNLLSDQQRRLFYGSKTTQNPGMRIT